MVVKNPLVVSYVRYSTKRQGSEGRDSVRRQQALSLAYCERRQWTLDETVRMDAGRSSYTKGKQKELLSILADIEARVIPPGSVLIVESIDRISRQGVDEGYDLLKKILKAGVRIVTLSPEREYDAECLTGLTKGVLELLIILERAHEESKIKSERVAQSYERRRTTKTKKMPSVPGWLERTTNNGFKIKPQEASIIRRIFTEIVGGKGTIAICQDLNREGIKTFKQGKHWYPAYISKMLKDRTVIGEYQPRRRTNEKKINAGAADLNYYPPVVETELYYRAVSAFSTRKKIKSKGVVRVPNLFTGLLFDAVDKTAFQLTQAKNVHKLIAVGGKRGTSAYLAFDYKFFELAFLHFCQRELILDEENKPKIQQQIEEVQGLVSEKTERMARLQKMLLTDEDVEHIGAAIKELKHQKQDYLLKLETLKAQLVNNTQVVANEVKDMASRYEEAVVGGNEFEFRGILKNKIAQVVAEMWVVQTSKSRYHRNIICQVFFRSGGSRFLTLDYKRGCDAIFGSGKAEDLGIDIDLRNYRPGLADLLKLQEGSQG